MHLHDMIDLTSREKLIFLPMLAVMFWMGIYPTSFLNLIHAPVASMVDNYNHGLAGTGLVKPVAKP